MRLTSTQHQAIKSTFLEVFQEGEIYLFGSRVNDAGKGGDIDLYLEAVPEYMITVKKKIAFIVGLKKYLGDQRIDVIFKSTDNSSSRFQQIIEKTKVPIN